MRYFAMLLMLFVQAGQAVEIAGVNLPEQVDLPGASQVLYLNGAGVRQKFFFDIYVASLYVTANDSDPRRLVAADAPKRVQMDMLYRKVEKDKFIEGWNEGFAANQTAAQLQPLRARLARFNGCFETLVKGDRVTLDYLPGQGTRVTIRGVEKCVIPGLDFNQALLRVWLGDAPVTDSLKKALLGR